MTNSISQSCGQVGEDNTCMAKSNLRCNNMTKLRYAQLSSAKFLNLSASGSPRKLGQAPAMPNRYPLRLTMWEPPLKLMKCCPCRET